MLHTDPRLQHMIYVLAPVQAQFAAEGLIVHRKP
jgi:hypothetical protein